MPLEIVRGDLFDAKVDALIHPSNCVATFGGGLSRQFRNRFPEIVLPYQRACKSGSIRPGHIHVYDRETDSPRFIISLPTKRHWRDPSKIEDIATGLDALVDAVAALHIISVAIPPLGCGLGGLDWLDVEPLITAAAARMNARVVVYSPDASRSRRATDSRKARVRVPKPI